MEPIQIAILVGFGLILFGLIGWVTKRSIGMDRKYYKRRWEHVLKTLKDGDSGTKLAVIDADKLVDHALKARRVNGESMGDRLRNAESMLGKNYQKLWDAHKYRNRLVHEEVKLKKNEVKSSMRAFEKALKDLGAL